VLSEGENMTFYVSEGLRVKEIRIILDMFRDNEIIVKDDIINKANEHLSKLPLFSLIKSDVNRNMAIIKAVNRNPGVSVFTRTRRRINTFLVNWDVYDKGMIYESYGNPKDNPKWSKI
jgi:hypothetical protein